MTSLARALAFAAFALAAPLAAPLSAKDSLGVFGTWAAFRDAERAHCYAIAKPNTGAGGYATIAHWPRARIRGQFHVRLSRPAAASGSVRLAIGDQRFDLTARGADAWASDPREDAAILAALRSASRMSVSAQGARGGRFTDRYDLTGVATAIDASLVACTAFRP
ncbi:MAG: hypothetical protein V2I27_14700 [Erythrobacter sp.]|jgi:hypothetical protein|nr:hypothetical protein [Erythrobacter sp.]